MYIRTLYVLRTGAHGLAGLVLAGPLIILDKKGACPCYVRNYTHIHIVQYRQAATSLAHTCCTSVRVHDTHFAPACRVRTYNYNYCTAHVHVRMNITYRKCMHAVLWTAVVASLQEQQWVCVHFPQYLEEA